MAEVMNLIISWVISVCFAFLAGYFYGTKKRAGKKKTEMLIKAEPTADQLYAREKRVREERNFWNYDGSEQNE